MQETMWNLTKQVIVLQNRLQENSSHHSSDQTMSYSQTLVSPSSSTLKSPNPNQTVYRKFPQTAHPRETLFSPTKSKDKIDRNATDFSPLHLHMSHTALNREKMGYNSPSNRVASFKKPALGLDAFVESDALQYPNVGSLNDSQSEVEADSFSLEDIVQVILLLHLPFFIVFYC